MSYDGFSDGDFIDKAGKGGLTQSGTAQGGSGYGGGGSAVTGNTGNANGGSVGNFGSVIVNGYKSSELNLRFYMIELED